jgi:hypothetical protein
MAKSKRLGFTGRGRGSSGGRTKGRAVNAQAHRGFLAKDTFFRTEGTVSDFVHEPGAPAGDEERNDEGEEEQESSSGTPLLLFPPFLVYPPLVQMLRLPFQWRCGSVVALTSNSSCAI